MITLLLAVKNEIIIHDEWFSPRVKYSLVWFGGGLNSSVGLLASIRMLASIFLYWKLGVGLYLGVGFKYEKHGNLDLDTLWSKQISLKKLGHLLACLIL